MAQVTRANSKLKFQTGDVPTQADFEDLHDSVRWKDESPNYFVLDAATYGNGSTNASAHIQSVYDAAKAVNGVVIVPRGVYLINATVIFDNLRVSFVGFNPADTIFRPAAGFTGTMFSTGTNSTIRSGATVQDVIPSGIWQGIQFDGLNQCATAVDLAYMYWWKWQNLFFNNFTGIATKFTGVLVGKADNCVWDKNTGGHIKTIRGENDTVDTGIMQSNMVTFDNCHFYQCPAIAMEWEKAALLNLKSCNFEFNGTEGNASTGGLFVTDVPSGERVGVTLDGCWFERSKGTDIKISGSFAGYHTIRNTIAFSHGSVGLDVGANHTVTIHDSNIENHNTDILLNGGHVIYLNSRLPIVSSNSGGTLRTVALTDVTPGGGDVTAPTLSSAVVNNSTPTQIELNYNETLNASSVPATSAFTVSGGKTVSSVAVSGAKVTVTVNSAYVNGDVITISYTAGASPIEDAAGNNAANLTSQSVTNNIGSAAPTSGLLAYWDFEETSGNFTDKSGNAKDLTRLNSAGTTTGKVGNAAQFTTASSQRLQSTSGTGLSATTGFTIAGWVNLTGVSATQGMFGKGTFATSNAEYGLYVTGGSIGFWSTRDGLGGTYVEVVKTGYTTGWHFVVCKWNGTTLSISVDNGTETTAAQASMFSGSASLYFGGDAGTAGANFMNGMLDQFRIYNRALTSSEITTLYNSGNGL